MKKLAFGLAMIAASLISHTATAAEYRDHTVKFAVTTPAGTPPVQGMEIFAKKMAERSGGKIKIKLFPNGGLGSDEQVLSSLQGGVIEMMMWNAGNMISQVQDFGLLDLPFLYTDLARVDSLLDGEVGNALMAQLPARGVVGLAFWELGMRQLTNNERPVTKFEDLNGLKIRVQQSPLIVDTWAALGTNPTPLAFTELHSALDTGAVDGQENPVSLIYASKFNETQKYLSITNHNYNAHLLMVAKSFWDKLNSDEQQLFKEVAMEVRLEERALSRNNDRQIIEKLKAAGMQVNVVSNDEIIRFREKLRPVILEYSKKFNPELVKKAFDTVGFSNN